MLYDPKWEAIYTVEAFGRWLAQKPRGETYEYIDAMNCAAAQYLQAHGVGGRDSMLEVERLKELGWYDVVRGTPRTFGAAADRAKGRAGWLRRAINFIRTY